MCVSIVSCVYLHIFHLHLFPDIAYVPTARNLRNLIAATNMALAHMPSSGEELLQDVVRSYMLASVFLRLYI